MAGVALAALLVSTPAAAHAQFADTRVVDSLARIYPPDCRDVQLLNPSPDSTVQRRSCVLLSAAIAEVGRGHAREFGFVPADTALVRKAIVSEMHFQILPSRESGAWYYVVSLGFGPGRRTLKVQIDHDTGCVGVAIDHPMGGRSP